jgi:hypothetical protein
MLYNSFILVALTSLASAAVVTSNASTPSFMLFAYRPDAPFHKLPLVASGNGIWVGGSKKTSSYCPEMQQKSGWCLQSSVPPRTMFVQGNGGCALNGSIPGGQQVWASKAQKGAWIYSTPHTSGDQTQDDAGYKITEKVATKSGHLNQLVMSDARWFACPSGDSYQVHIYSNKETKKAPKFQDCLQFMVQKSSAQEWQY